MNKWMRVLSDNSESIFVAASAFAIGFGVGYYVRSTKYPKIELNPDVPAEDSDEVIDDDENLISRAEYDAFIKEVERTELESSLKREQDAIKQALRNEGTHFEEYEIVEDGIPHYPKDRPDPADIVASLPPNNADYPGWDYENEVKERTKLHPYVLHRDEFYAEELGYDQTTLTYFTVDDVMVDQEDHPISGYSAVVGDLRFGHGSGDENVFYARNDVLHAEYEIIQLPESFVSYVLGVDTDEAVG